MSKDRRLGRGLAALLGTPLDEEGPGTDGGSEAGSERDRRPARSPGRPPAGQAAAAREDGPPEREAPHDSPLIELKVDTIQDNPFQPRRDFGESEIAALAESLREHRMLQPILVRRTERGYQLISGERRLRAAIQAGWTTVPAQVREADDRLVAELAIVENLQRKDLNPIEKALSFKRYLEQHGCSQEDLARRLSIDRSTIANLMRLLELPESVLDALRKGELSAGHARALLPLGDEVLQVEFCQRILQEGWSVRTVESQVQQRIREEDGPLLSLSGEPAGGSRSKPPAARPRSDQVGALEQELRMAVGSKIEIRQTRRGRGRIILHFANRDEFERIRQLLVAPGDTAAARVG